MLPIGSAQHVQAFCQLVQGLTGRAVCSGWEVSASLGAQSCTEGHVSLNKVSVLPPKHTAWAPPRGLGGRNQIALPRIPQ